MGERRHHRNRGKENKLIRFQWPSGEESEVTFELKPQNDGVLLVLTHRRLGDDIDILASVGSGWHTHLGILIDRLHSRNPKGFWTVYTKMEEAYKKLIRTQ